MLPSRTHLYSSGQTGQWDAILCMPAFILLLQAISDQDEKVAGPFAAPHFPRSHDLRVYPFFSFFKTSSPALPRRGRFKAAPWPLAPLPRSQFQYWSTQGGIKCQVERLVLCAPVSGFVSGQLLSAIVQGGWGVRWSCLAVSFTDIFIFPAS